MKKIQQLWQHQPKVTFPTIETRSASYDTKNTSPQLLVDRFTGQVQKAFADIDSFFSPLQTQVSNIQRQIRIANLGIVAANQGDPLAGESSRSPVCGYMRRPMDEVSTLLDRCQSLCGTASLYVMRYGDSRGKILAMRDTFAEAVEKAARFS